MKRFVLSASAIVLGASLTHCSNIFGSEDAKPPVPTENGADCDPAARYPGDAPIARLTTREYARTVKDLFPGVTLPSVELPAENVVEGYDNNSAAQTPSPVLVERLRLSAIGVADAATAQLDRLLPCPHKTDAEQSACAPQFIASLARRAYRRPVSDEELTRLRELYTKSRAAWNFHDAVSLVVQAVLQSPHFLYRFELGREGAGEVPLTPYEVASRLSYFFWDTMPDEQLFAAAESGKLDDDAGLEEEARRLLADPRAKEAVAHFQRQWLNLGKLESLQKDRTLYPEWNEGVANALRDGTARYVDYLFWEKGSLSAFFTDGNTFLDGPSATALGFPAPSGSGLNLVALDPSQRAGILTQPGILAASAHARDHSPVLRGVFVLDRFLCEPPPPPPKGVSTTFPEQKEGAAIQTTRQRMEQQHEKGSCAACHKRIDGVGFAFENYDALGRYRTKELGLDIESSSWLEGTRDADGRFQGAVELAQRLSTSTQVRDCVASQWVGYALGVERTSVSACAVSSIGQAFDARGKDMKELLVATIKSPTFRYRAAERP